MSNDENISKIYRNQGKETDNLFLKNSHHISATSHNPHKMAFDFWGVMSSTLQKNLCQVKDWISWYFLRMWTTLIICHLLKFLNWIKSLSKLVIETMLVNHARALVKLLRGTSSRWNLKTRLLYYKKKKRQDSCHFEQKNFCL